VVGGSGSKRGRIARGWEVGGQVEVFGGGRWQLGAGKVSGPRY